MARTVVAAGLLLYGAAAAADWLFRNVTAEAGLDYRHDYVAAEPAQFERFAIAGGAAAGDVDGDGDVDLYVIAGNAGANRLYLNDGSGRFSASAAGPAAVAFRVAKPDRTPFRIERRRAGGRSSSALARRQSGDASRRRRRPDSGLRPARYFPQRF